VGYLAGQTSQGANSIILNATGVALDSTTASSFHVKPVRGGNFAASALAYTADGEIVEETGTHFDANGRVGIGTTNPSHALTVAAASGDAEVHIQAQGNDGGDAILYFNGSPTNQRKCAIISSNVAPNAYCKQDLHFCMETTNDLTDVDITDSKMVITNTGDVGIGTTNPLCGLDVRTSGTRCSYPFGIGGSSTYASRVEFQVSVSNNAAGWSKDLVAGTFERGGWIRVFSGATQSAGAASGAVLSPREATFVYSIYGDYLYWNRVSGSTAISLSNSGYQTIRVTVTGGGSYTWGYIEAYQQGGIAIF